MLVACEEFAAGKKLSLRWRGPGRIVYPVNYFVFQVEDLRNGSMEDVHATRLKFYHYAFFYYETIMPHVIF